MTVGVTVVQFQAGVSTVTLDTHGYVPKAILFFGGYSQSDYATRFFGAYDGTNQWAASEFRRSGLTSRASPSAARYGYGGRTDRCIEFLSYSGSTVQLDTGAHVTSVAIDTISLSWNESGTAFSNNALITAVVFYGDQWTVAAGAASAGTGAGTDTVIGFQPDLIFLANPGHNVSFGTGAPTQDPAIFDTQSFGWATFPEPAYDPNSFLAGTTNTTTFGQKNTGVSMFTTDTARTTDFTVVGNTHLANTKSGNNVVAHRGTTKFTLISSVTETGTFGYLAIKWTQGRIVAGYVVPTSLATTESFYRFGGTYSAPSTDTNPSNHAQPSFMLMMPNAGYAGTPATIWDLGYTQQHNSVSYCAFDASYCYGFAYGGGPCTLGAFPTTTIGSENATKEIVTSFNSRVPVLDKHGAVVMQFTLASFDGDGITVDYQVSPISSAMKWPYLAFTNDAGDPNDNVYLSVTEPSDTCGVELLANRVVTTLTATEPSDTASAHIIVSDLATLTVTEPMDTFHFGTGEFGLLTPIEGEVIYVEFDNRRFFVPGDPTLPFVQPNDPQLVVDAEDNTFHVPRDIADIIVPPVEEGPWV